MSEPVHEDKLEKILMKCVKSELVKTDLANEMICPGGWGNIDNSTDENKKLDNESEKCYHDYIKHHDWKHDSEYQKLMNKSI